MKNTNNKHAQAKIAALILAGGQGSRMNFKDKGLCKINNLSFVEIIAQLLASQVSDIFVSTNTNTQIYESMGFHCINDQPFPSEGPLCAIASGLLKIQCDYLVIVPCDSPAISSDLVGQLLQQLESDHSDVVCVKNNGRIEPLFSIIRARLLHNVEASIEAGIRKTQDWILSERHSFLMIENDDMYFNINTKQQLDEYINKAIKERA